MRDPIEALEAELALVKDERDNWKEEAMLKATEAEAFMLQRDALAAHVEALVAWADAYVGTTGLYEEVESARNANTTSLARLKAQCWREAYLAGMEAGHHWTVEGGYVAGGDEEAAEDYVADRQAEGGE